MGAPKTKKFRVISNTIIGTYGTDYLEQISCKSILNKCQEYKLKDKISNSWDTLVVKAHGDEEINHDHFHFICFWKGKKKCDITNEKYFDLPLEKEIYSCEDQEGTRHYELKENVNDIQFNEYRKKYKNIITLSVAHPNFKGQDKKKFGSEYDMLNYVWKQKIEFESTFNVEVKLEELKNKKLQDIKKQLKRTELKDQLCEYIREQWLIGTPKDTVIHNILNDSNLSKIYLTQSSIQNFVDKQFNKAKQEKPRFIFGTYYVPNEIAEFLNYLDKFTKSYYEEVIIPCKNGKYPDYQTAMENFQQKYKERGKCLIFKGKGGIGKTALFGCYGPCSYWKDRFNYDQWNNWGFFNWFDDVDIYSKSLNTELKKTAEDWDYLKTWIGGQYNSTFTGKYRSVKTVINYKPCIFTTNIPIEERFNKRALNYMKELGTVTFSEANHTLYKKPNKNTINNYFKITKIDTTKTYYYKNIYSKQINKRKSENSDKNIPISPKKQKTVLEYEEEEPILIEDKSADIIISNNDLASTSSKNYDFDNGECYYCEHNIFTECNCITLNKKCKEINCNLNKNKNK